MTDNGDDRTFETSDRWAINCLRLEGHVPTDISTIPGKREDNPILVYTFAGKAAYKLFDEWIRGLPYPVGALQDVQEVDAEFKRNMHEYSRRHRSGK